MMKPYNTYRSIVFTITTAFLFFCWGLISNIVSSNLIYGLVLGAIISLGSYRIILKIVEFLLLKIKKVKKCLFGSTYLEGIWIGCYLGFENKLNFYIECYEQDLNGLVIRGRCYSSDYSFKGTWVSEKVILDADKGVLSYTYETDMVYNNHKNQGLAIFNFDRPNKNKAPNRLIGFSSDIYTPRKFLSVEKRIEFKKGTTDFELIGQAKKLYEENEDLFYSKNK